MCKSACDVVQGPRVATPLHTAAQPDNEASEKISMSGFLGKKSLPFDFSKLKTHHSKSDLDSDEREHFTFKLPPAFLTSVM